MKLVLVLVMAGVVLSPARAGDFVIQKATGDVSVRHGVMEQWTKVAVGDVLKPDDTMKTGKRGSVVLVAQTPKETTAASGRITLPPEVIVDLSDIRELSQEELMLKLTMEKVRASSYQWKSDELHIPNAAVVHGANEGDAGTLTENDPEIGLLQWNGAKVLYSNGYYSTCVLKAMEIFRLYPSVGATFENRLLVADALEKANLRGEALSEYGALSQMPGLTPEQQSMLQTRMRPLQQ